MPLRQRRSTSVGLRGALRRPAGGTLRKASGREACPRLLKTQDAVKDRHGPAPVHTGQRTHLRGWRGDTPAPGPCVPTSLLGHSLLHRPDPVNTCFLGGRSPSSSRPHLKPDNLASHRGAAQVGKKPLATLAPSPPDRRRRRPPSRGPHVQFGDVVQVPLDALLKELNGRQHLPRPARETRLGTQHQPTAARPLAHDVPFPTCEAQ